VRQILPAVARNTSRQDRGTHREQPSYHWLAWGEAGSTIAGRAPSARTRQL